jgi:carbon storage regulator
MLVLSRCVGQRLVLDNGTVWITVVSSRDGRVELGIDAPPEVTIDREEVHIRKEKGIPHPNSKTLSLKKERRHERVR